MNFWGVTFADDSDFYATMSTTGGSYLVPGSLATQTVRTVADNVECPSLSPDGTRMAFKEAVGSDPRSGVAAERTDAVFAGPCASGRDAQRGRPGRWLDDHTVVYALPHGSSSDVWQRAGRRFRYAVRPHPGRHLAQSAGIGRVGLGIPGVGVAGGWGGGAGLDTVSA